MGKIAKNLTLIRQRIEAAAARSGRSASSVTLVAVSKQQPPSLIREAYDAGQRAFGENYAQDLRDKAADLADLDISWHFIGHLQKNKAKYVAKAASVMETIDSLDLAQELDRRLERPLRCLVEVNVGGEATKSGIDPDSVVPLIRSLGGLKNIRVTGLMAIPPFDENDPEFSRPYFRRLAELLRRTNDELKLEIPLRDISMGMSHDFEVAIEEGATIIRVGTAIFGERVTMSY